MEHDRQKQYQQTSKSRDDFRDLLIKALTDLVINKLFLGTITLLIIGMVLLVIAYTLSLPQSLSFIPDLAKQVGAGVLITGVISGLLQILIVSTYNKFVDQNSRFLRDDVTKSLEDVKLDIEEQTDTLVQTVSSLEAMSKLGIVRVYSKRQDARADMVDDIQDPALSRIYLVGISLNDFIGGKDRNFNQVWTTINEYIDGTRPLPKHTKSLDIKVLVIDPHCHGAHLRSFGENRQPGASSSRLYAEVGGTINDLLALQRTAQQNWQKTGVTFEFRLYRLPPQLFLFSTDKVSYIEPYYFWASRAVDTSMPFLRCGDGQTAALHQGMHDHFKLIWEYASVTASQYYEQHNQGLDEGLHLSGAVNVFHDHRLARPRISWLLEHAKQRMYIQGISLRSYFDGRELNRAIRDLVEAGNVEVKVLLLHPDSEQARYRSYREYLLNKPPLTFEAYQQDPELHKTSDLYRDTQRTIERILSLQPHAKFQFRLYNSAPTNFMLLVDDTVIVEQYHYGDLRSPRVSTVSNILGEDTTLFEYTCESRHMKEQADLYGSPQQVQVRMLELMQNHFEFVFDDCAVGYTSPNLTQQDGHKQPV